MPALATKSGDVLFSDVEFATSFKARFIGLLGRASISPSEALIFNNCRSVHMFGMRFPIDVIYLDSKARVIKVVNRLKPWSFSYAVDAKSIVEVKAGRCAALGVRVGQTLTVREG